MHRSTTKKHQKVNINPKSRPARRSPPSQRSNTRTFSSPSTRSICTSSRPSSNSFHSLSHQSTNNNKLMTKRAPVTSHSSPQRGMAMVLNPYAGQFGSDDAAAHRSTKQFTYISPRSADRPISVLLAGQSGFIGQHLYTNLDHFGFDVVSVNRERNTGLHRVKTLSYADIEAQGLPDVDFIINAAGSNFWTSEREFHNVESSRVETNQFWSDQIRRSRSKPYAFVTLSSAYIYPAHPTQEYTEDWNWQDSRFAQELYVRKHHRQIEQYLEEELEKLRLAAAEQITTSSGEVNEQTVQKAAAISTATLSASSFLQNLDASSPILSQDTLQRRSFIEDIFFNVEQSSAVFFAERDTRTPEQKAEYLAALRRYARDDEKMGVHHQLYRPTPQDLQNASVRKDLLSNEDVRVISMRLGHLVCRHMQETTNPIVASKINAGLAAYVEDGSSITPWIHIDDACNLIVHSMANHTIRGPVNAVAPTLTTNKDLLNGIIDLQNTLRFLRNGVSLHHFINMFGVQRANLLATTRKVIPQVALDTGFRWQYPTIDDVVKNGRHSILEEEIFDAGGWEKIHRNLPRRNHS